MFWTRLRTEVITQAVEIRHLLATIARLEQDLARERVRSDQFAEELRQRAPVPKDDMFEEDERELANLRARMLTQAPETVLAEGLGDAGQLS